ncbi:MAG: HPr(Ser) kinase/phosphatase [Verrucomicrobia bacterium]|nr:HPr(Ser) kinase/phosphatase [Verrucomicrobiota bacterium]MDE3099642.1 HPr(Ser) kinase/phosphatase [Verrucomicrobiota bacterium]
MQPNSVTVEQFYREHTEALQMRLLAGEKQLDRLIREPTVNRPGLALSGFTRYFAYKRVQAVGHAEAYYLRSLPTRERQARYAYLFAYKIPCIVFSRNLKPDKEFFEASEVAGVPVFQTPLVTMKFINAATLALEMMFAPRGTEMGSMVDVLGVGVLIRGESGIGKSEAVLALIERGYSLVADDVTRVTLVDGREVVGTSPELTRGHMEIRGIGIINVAAMFGVKSIRQEKVLNLVVSLKPWEEVHEVERIGMEQEFVKVLGVDVPHMIIPVRTGRDLARLIEVAAFQTKLKLSGYNAAQDLNERLIAQMKAAKPDAEKI